jgi:hypothetical protein
MHLVGYLYEDYHDARSLEHKVPKNVASEFRRFILLIPRICSLVLKQAVIVYGTLNDFF